MIGSQLAHFRVTAKLGAGGMGEVYRAEDTRLGREVAIKVLPEHFTADPERLGRFEREARLLASLTHPNVAALYEIGCEGELHYLVMELAAGETLEERMARRPLPLEDAIEIALQVVEALQAAHQRGIVHRDLKPANVMLDADGAVKVLDFGLARALDPGAAAEGSGSAGSVLAASPTLTYQFTEVGVLLGTAAYMSPEQARGKPADQRADIWAFGVLLWEMLTGQRLFSGETLSDTLAAVLRKEPSLEALPAGTPRPLRRLLRRCLRKTPRERLQDIGDARLELLDALNPEERPADSSPQPRTLRRPAILLVAGLASGLALGAAVASVLWWTAGSARTSRPALLSLTLPEAAPAASGSFVTSLAFSPEGDRLVYVGIDAASSERRLYLRSLDDDSVRALPGTEGAEQPFFSPDGRSVGFWSQFKIRAVETSGGALPRVICDAVDIRGATWTPDGRILFADQNNPLYEVPATGGAPRPVSVLADGEIGHRHPSLLPDGETVIFAARGRDFVYDRATVSTLSLRTGERRTLFEAGHDVRVSPTGHLLYVQAGHLVAVPFDLERLEVRGEAVPLVADVAVQFNTGAAQFAVSPRGDLVYQTGGLIGDDPRLVLVDRAGQREELLQMDALARYPRFSPDGQRLLLMVIGRQVQGAWVVDRETLSRRRLHAPGIFPVWFPDGKSVVMSQIGSPRNTIVRQWFADGRIDTLYEDAAIPTGVSPDGRVALTLMAGGTHDVVSVSGEGGEAPRPFLAGPANDLGLRHSPDGRYAAFLSDRTGRYEVYVTTFPDAGPAWQISTDGGTEPLWSPTGRELFFRRGADLVAIPVSFQPTFQAGAPQVLFQGPYEGLLGTPGNANYDVTPDGESFLMVYSPELDTRSHELRVALDWPALLTRDD